MNRAKIDLLLIMPLATILGLGLFTLNSALSYNSTKFFIQGVWVILAVIAFLVTSYRNKRTMKHLATPLFFANIILLILVLVIGKKIGGSQRWLDLGFMNFQVSELSKLAVILFLSYRLNQKPTMKDGYKVWDLIPEVGAVLLTVLLIHREPDLGTALLVMMLSVSIIASTKINKKSVALLTLAALILAPIGWKFVLKPYQKRRIVALVTMHSSEKSDLALTSQYHTKQSIIAIGSGRISGKGYRKGTQNMLRFIPEHHTDFIFSVYAEEFGFLGVLLLFSLYAMLFLRAIWIISTVKEKFEALIIVGTISMLWLQIIINIGMVTGILPVVGIPLPFFSYGGSALMVYAVLMGLIHNFSITNRYRQ